MFSLRFRMRNRKKIDFDLSNPIAIFLDTKIDIWSTWSPQKMAFRVFELIF